MVRVGLHITYYHDDNLQTLAPFTPEQHSNITAALQPSPAATMSGALPNANRPGPAWPPGIYVSPLAPGRRLGERNSRPKPTSKSTGPPGSIGMVPSATATRSTGMGSATALGCSRTRSRSRGRPRPCREKEYVDDDTLIWEEERELRKLVGQVTRRVHKKDDPFTDSLLHAITLVVVKLGEWVKDRIEDEEDTHQASGLEAKQEDAQEMDEGRMQS